jgi:hypothetical protein
MPVSNIGCEPSSSCSALSFVAARGQLRSPLVPVMRSAASRGQRDAAAFRRRSCVGGVWVKSACEPCRFGARRITSFKGAAGGASAALLNVLRNGRVA